MGLLLNQFISAAQEWHQRVPQPDRESRESAIVFYTMFFTGGSASVQPLEAKDEDSLTWEQRKEMTGREVRGYYSLELMGAYLTMLMRRTNIIETFLIPSLVRAIEAEFQDYVDSYEAGIAKNQERIAELRAIDSDQDRRAVYLDTMKETHAQFVAEGKFPPDHPFEEESAIEDQIEFISHFSEHSPEEKTRRETVVSLWREVTQEMMTPENLQQAKDEQLKAWRDREGY